MALQRTTTRLGCSTALLMGLWFATGCSDDGAPEVDIGTTTGAGVTTDQDGELAVEELADFVEGRDVDLARAIDSAQVQVVDGTPVEATLELFGDEAVYEVVVFSQGTVEVVSVDTEDFTVLSSRPDPGADRGVDALLAASVDWETLVAAAESAAGGTAFEIVADGVATVFEADVFVEPASVVEVTLQSDGTVVEVSEPSDGG